MVGVRTELHPTPLFDQLGGPGPPGRADLCCCSFCRFAKQAPSPLLLPVLPVLPAAPVLAAAGRLEAQSSLQTPRCSSLPPLHPTRLVFLLNLTSPFPGTPLAAGRLEGAERGLGPR